MVNRTAVLNGLHKGTVVALSATAIWGLYELYYRINDFRGRKAIWNAANPTFKDDPYYQFNPNYMRFMHKDEEEVLLTRPLWYCAKGFREKYGIPMQFPYEPVENSMCDINGKLVIDRSSYAKYLDGEDPLAEIDASPATPETKQ